MFGGGKNYGGKNMRERVDQVESADIVTLTAKQGDYTAQVKIANAPIQLLEDASSSWTLWQAGLRELWADLRQQRQQGKAIGTQQEMMRLLKEAHRHAIEWGYPYGGPPTDPHCRFCGVEWQEGDVGEYQGGFPNSIHEEDCLLLRIEKLQMDFEGGQR